MWEEYVQVQLIFGIISVVVRVVVAGINVIGHHLLWTVYKGFQIAHGFSIIILVIIKLFSLLQVFTYLQRCRSTRSSPSCVTVKSFIDWLLSFFLCKNMISYYKLSTFSCLVTTTTTSTTTTTTTTTTMTATAYTTTMVTTTNPTTTTITTTNYPTTTTATATPTTIGMTNQSNILSEK